MAARSSRLRLGSMLLAPLRNPVQTAKTIATLDQVSSGRVMIGAVAGWYEKEFRAVGIDYRKRGELLERNLGLIRLLLTQDDVTYRYDNYVLEHVTIEPKPVQKPTPPLLIGGYADNVLRRVVKLSDGWVSYCYTPGAFREAWGRVLEYARGYGRAPSSLTSLELVPLCIDRDREAASRRLRIFAEKGYLDFPPWSKATLESAIAGSIEECQARIASYIDAGVESLVLIPCDYDLGQVERAGEELIPAFTRR